MQSIEIERKKSGLGYTKICTLRQLKGTAVLKVAQGVCLPMCHIHTHIYLQLGLYANDRETYNFMKLFFLFSLTRRFEFIFDNAFCLNYKRM